MLLVVAVSGVYLLKPEWLDPTVSLASPVLPSPEPAPLRADARSCGGPTTLAAAVAAAGAAAPGTTFRVAFADGSGPFHVELHGPGDQNWRSGDTEVWVARTCPQVLAIRHGRDRTAGERLKLAMLPMHDGTYLGPVGEGLVFLSGLLLPLLYVSGVVVWWRRRRQRLTARAG